MKQILLYCLRWKLIHMRVKISLTRSSWRLFLDPLLFLSVTSHLTYFNFVLWHNTVCFDSVHITAMLPYGGVRAHMRDSSRKGLLNDKQIDICVNIQNTEFLHKCTSIASTYVLNTKYSKYFNLWHILSCCVFRVWICNKNSEKIYR